MGSGSGSVEVVFGDLFGLEVEAIVNPWNRNFLPWWLLLPRGVSGELRRRAGAGVFRELGRAGSLGLGEAVVTGAGRLGDRYRGIVHVAGLDWHWMASERSVRLSARSAARAAGESGFASLGVPLIGAGTGGLDGDRVEGWLREEFGRALAGGLYGGRVVVARLGRDRGRDRG